MVFLARRDIFSSLAEGKKDGRRGRGGWE